MNFRIIKKEKIEDNSIRFILKTKAEEMIYLGYFLEPFEGWCNYTTIDKKRTLFQIDVTPDYEEKIGELLEFLQNWNYEL